MRYEEAAVQLSHFKIEELKEGDTFVFRDRFSAVDVDEFARLSGDVSPLHVSSDYAKKSGFEDRVVHGVLSTGLVSRMIGVHLPGVQSIISSINIKFIKPIIIDTDLEVTGEVTQVSLAVGVVIVKVKVTSMDQSVNFVTADVTVKIRK
ncbi:MAG: acyl dehydratase [Magnetococcales bacterium]|nr:acyl dehydratase [Magnetococcales bacterium]